MYLKNLNNRLDDYLRESVIPYLLELIRRRILDSGYKLTDLKTYDFEEEIKTTLGSSLHNFHGYVNSSIESLIYSWNEEGKEEDKFLSILDQPSDSAKLIMLGKKISN